MAAGLTTSQKEALSLLQANPALCMPAGAWQSLCGIKPFTLFSLWDKGLVACVDVDDGMCHHSPDLVFGLCSRANRRAGGSIDAEMVLEYLRDQLETSYFDTGYTAKDLVELSSALLCGNQLDAQQEKMFFDLRAHGKKPSMISDEQVEVNVREFLAAQKLQAA